MTTNNTNNQFAITAYTEKTKDIKKVVNMYNTKDDKIKEQMIAHLTDVAETIIYREYANDAWNETAVEHNEEIKNENKDIHDKLAANGQKVEELISEIKVYRDVAVMIYPGIEVEGYAEKYGQTTGHYSDIYDSKFTWSNPHTNEIEKVTGEDFGLFIQQVEVGSIKERFIKANVGLDTKVISLDDLDKGKSEKLETLQDECIRAINEIISLREEKEKLSNKLNKNTAEYKLFDIEDIKEAFANVNKKQMNKILPKIYADFLDSLFNGYAEVIKPKAKEILLITGREVNTGK